MNKQCANCGTEVNGKFCHECGQKAKVARLTIHELVHEVWHAFTHTDKGVLKLIKDLFLRPKSVYDNYFIGQRKKYFSPVLFFLVTAGIIAYLYPFIFDYEDKITNRHNEYGRDLYHLTKYRALILLPFQTLLLWLVFRRRYNLAEVAAFLLFCLGFTYTIRIICLPLYFPLIRNKSDIDNVLIFGSLIIIWLHGSVVLARRSVVYIFLMFLVVNIYLVLDSTLQMYMLFGKDMLTNNNLEAGIHSFWDIVKMSYRW